MLESSFAADRHVYFSSWDFGDAVRRVKCSKDLEKAASERQQLKSMWQVGVWLIVMHGLGIWIIWIQWKLNSSGNGNKAFANFNSKIIIHLYICAGKGYVYFGRLWQPADEGA